MAGLGTCKMGDLLNQPPRLACFHVYSFNHRKSLVKKRFLWYDIGISIPEPSFCKGFFPSEARFAFESVTVFLLRRNRNSELSPHRPEAHLLSLQENVKRIFRDFRATSVSTITLELLLQEYTAAFLIHDRLSLMERHQAVCQQ